MNDGIGKRIRCARKAAGLTQLNLAEKAFISESYMALMELDKRNPSTDVLKNIAKTLGVSADYLLFESIPQNEMTLFSEWKELMQERSAKEIAAAHKIVKTFFDNIDKFNKEDND